MARQNRSLVCVVIPVYKPFDALSGPEVVSLQQCMRVLHKHPLFFFGPHSLNWSGYEKFCGEAGTGFQKKEFEDEYFRDIDGYNRLMTNAGFYEAFNRYRYMLLYQTDCFVFRDELDFWCAKGYDYIGAPWLGIDMGDWFRYPWYPRSLIWTRRLGGDKVIGKVGNGGFSLRKIDSLRRNLKRFSGGLENWMANEDNFFCHYVGTYNPFFKIPGVSTALQFGFDAFPREAYELNNHRLPFGCHGWFREDVPYYENNLLFWEPFVQASLAGTEAGQNGKQL